MADLRIGEDPAHPLYGPGHKLARAYEQLEVLEGCVDRFRQSVPVAVERKYDPKRHERLYCIRVLRPPDPDVALLIGEIVYNVRSSLDHLANILVREGGPPTTFPIAKNRSKFWRRDRRTGKFAERSGADKIRHMPGWARRLICEVQPYQRGNDAPKDLLWVLHELANHDKHQALIPLVCVGTDSAINVTGPQGERLGLTVSGAVVNYGPVYDGKVVARIPLPEKISDSEMALDFEMATVEAFTEPHFLAEAEFLIVLKAIIARVLNQVIIERFEPYFR